MNYTILCMTKNKFTLLLLPQKSKPMNVWLKTENTRRNSLRSSWASSRSSLDSPLPIITQTSRRGQFFQNSEMQVSELSNEEEQNSNKSSQLMWRQQPISFRPSDSYSRSHSKSNEKEIFTLAHNSHQKYSPKEENRSHSSGFRENYEKQSFNEQEEELEVSQYGGIISSKKSSSLLMNNGLNEYKGNRYQRRSDESYRASSSNLFIKKQLINDRPVSSNQESTNKNQFFNPKNSFHQPLKKYKNLFTSNASNRSPDFLSTSNNFPTNSHKIQMHQIRNLNRDSFANVNSSKNNINELRDSFYNSKDSEHIYGSAIHTKTNNMVHTNTNTNNSKRLLTTGRKKDIREYIVSIIQYCSNEVGLACYNINTGEIKLSQIVERMTYMRTISTLERFYPQEVIYSSTLENTPLIKKLMTIFKKTSFRPIKRNMFDETKGFYIYTQRGNINQYNPDNKFLSYAALNALVNFLESSFEVQLTYSALNIKWHFLEEVLIIDSQTIRDLEIFINYETKLSQRTFIENFRCLTDGGTRMLRANMLQPLTNIKQIEQRSDLLEYILHNKGVYDLFSKQVLKFKHYEPITAKFIQSPKKQNIKSIKSYLNSILALSKLCFEFENLKNKIKAFQGTSKILDKLQHKLSDKKLDQIRRVIRDNFDGEILKTFENPKLRNKKDNFIFLFKVEKIEDQFAQISRLTYSHTIEDIFRIFQSIKQKMKNIPMKLLYNQYRGYYISAKSCIDLQQLSKVIQDDILHINYKSNGVTFSTAILTSMNNRLKQNENKLIHESQSLLIKIIQEIQANLDILFEVSYWISILDMIICFVGFVKNYGATHQVTFSKPEFRTGDQEQMIMVENLRSVWSAQSLHKLSKNLDVKIEADTKVMCCKKSLNSTQELNMLTSLGYLTILAQMGCLVPAKSFKAPIHELMISKINVQSNTENKQSRFQMELYAIKNLLDNCESYKDGRCLILADQIVSGTQPEQQLAICLAFIQSIMQRSSTKCIALVSDQILLRTLKNMQGVQFYNKKSIQPSTQAHIEQLLNNTYNFSSKLLKKLEKYATNDYQPDNIELMKQEAVYESNNKRFSQQSSSYNND